MLGGSGTCSRGNFEMIDTIWLVLMYYFDQIKSYKSTIIYYKIIIIATHLHGYTLAIGDAPRKIKKKHALLDTFLSFLA